MGKVRKVRTWREVRNILLVSGHGCSTHFTLHGESDFSRCNGFGSHRGMSTDVTALVCTLSEVEWMSVSIKPNGTVTSCDLMLKMSICETMTYVAL